MPRQLAALLQKPPAVTPQLPAAQRCRQQVAQKLQQCSNCPGVFTTAAPVAGCHASSTLAVNVDTSCFRQTASLTPSQLAAMP